MGWFRQLRDWMAMPRRLRERGVLGLNRRSLDFIFPFNPRTSYRLVDDKLETKRLCERLALPIPETYAVVSRQGDLVHLDELIEDRGSFVVKPARGSGGKGVLVIAENRRTSFVTPRGTTVSPSRLRYHISAVLAGMFSLNGLPDRAIIEECIRPHDAFSDVSLRGTPDIRVLMFQGELVMAMLRLPTAASDGKANLHQGAVGVGIDIETGTTRRGVYQDRIVERHPDTGHVLAGRQVPHWESLVEAALRLAAAVDLGYLGIDCVLDRNGGPLILEVNARPGLAIQIANECGLLGKLRRLAEAGTHDSHRKAAVSTALSNVRRRAE